jgi:hypothetical protein
MVAGRVIDTGTRDQQVARQALFREMVGSQPDVSDSERAAG